MFFLFLIYIFLLYTGYFSHSNNYLFFSFLPFIIFFLFKKRYLLTLSLIFIFLSGFFVGYDKLPSIKTGKYRINVEVVRSLKKGYIVKNSSLSFYLTTYDEFFEGDKLYGIFNLRKMDDIDPFERDLKNFKINYKLEIFQIDSVKSGKSIARLRTILINRTREIYQDPNLNGFINSILFGYRKDLSYSIKRDFINSGIIHIIAISGQHIWVVYLFINFFLFFFPIKKRLKVIISILFLVFYSYLTYSTPSVVRSAIFITILFLGELLGKITDKRNLIFLTLIFMLIFNTNNFYDNGFSLSFLAVYGLFISEEKFHFKNNFFKIFFSSCIILVLTFPYMMFKFKYASIGSPIFTLAVLPFFNILLLFSLLSILPFLTFLVYPVKFLFKIILWIVSKSDNLPLILNYQIDIILFLLLELYFILLFEKKFKICFILSILTFFYVLYLINYL